MAEELFDESHYFMCGGGLKPCAFNAKQEIMKKETGEYYLTHKSLTTRNGDFSCRWMALLVAIIAALIAVLCATGVGMVLVAAMIGAAAGAAGGMLLCGYKAAVARTWLVIKTDAQIGTKNMVANRPGEHLKCSAFGQPITFLPNVTSEFHAILLFAGNVAMTGLEGFMYAYATRGVGMLVTKPLTFFANFGVNYLKTVTIWGGIARSTFGVWAGFSAYSNSETEGFHTKEVLTEAGKGFAFVETAAYRLATQDYSAEQKAKGNEILPKMYDEDGNEIFEGITLPVWSGDASLLLGLGGIQGRGKTHDAKLSDVPNKFVNETLKPLETFKKDVKSVIERAKEYRNRLKKSFKGKGVHETGLKKVGLKETDLSRIALEERAKLDMSIKDRSINHNIKTQGGNVAVYEYLDPVTGKLTKRVFTTRPDSGRHAERIGWETLEKEGIPQKNVRRIHSELEPCELNGANCKSCLNERFPNVEKTYNYDYKGSTKETIQGRIQGKSDRNVDFSRNTGTQSYPTDNEN